MKKFIIHLDEDIDRKNIWEFNNSWLEDAQFVKAINGKDIDHQLMEIKKFGINHTWRDPFKNRRITRGEVGCFISHYETWKHVIQENKPCLILEDDAVLDKDLWDEETWLFHMQEHKLDILYLGYNENEPKEVEDLGDVVKVGYPYNAHAYILSPEMANELVYSGYHRKIIPVDEILSQKTLTHNLGALKVEVAGQTPRSISPSKIEPMDDDDWFLNFKTHAITVGTDRSLCSALNDTATEQGFISKNLGSNVTWRGTDMSGPGGGHKINLVRDHLDTLNPNDVVLFTDAYDVFFIRSLEEITKRYLSMSTEIVFSAESTCWPDESMTTLHPKALYDSKYKFLNAGAYIGRVASLKEFFAERVDDEDDDQLYMQRVWTNNLKSKRPLSITLDYEQYIFQTHEPECVTIEKDILNPITNTHPCLYHGNGGPEAKAKFAEMYKAITTPNRFKATKSLKSETNSGGPMFIKHRGAIEIISDDMMIMDFMNQSQCERMIEIADKKNTWAPMPEDKFPAYEIRLTELGLWDEISRHWQEHVFPIVERYWAPMQMYGMRDGFVMRYSAETQKSLPMHCDASMVTGSVKLNEEYQGASLRFPRQRVNNDDVPVGKMILFPGQVTHGHECTELTSGVKYSLTMWTSRYPGDVNV